MKIQASVTLFTLLTAGSQVHAEPNARRVARTGVEIVNQVTKKLRDKIAATKSLPPSVRRLVARMPAAANAEGRRAAYSELSAEHDGASLEMMKLPDTRSRYLGTADSITLDRKSGNASVTWTPHDPVKMAVGRINDRVSTVSVDKDDRPGSSVVGSTHRRLTPVAGKPGAWKVITSRHFFRDHMPVDRDMEYVVQGEQVARGRSKTTVRRR